MNGMGVAETMRAVVRDVYGGSEVVRVMDVEVPSISEHEVLVRVAAVSLNRADWYSVTGPYIGRAQRAGFKPAPTRQNHRKGTR